MSGSDNVLVRFIAARCNNDLQCFLGSNLGLLHEEYDIVMTMNVDNVITYTHNLEDSNKAGVLSELISYRDGISTIDSITIADANELISALAAD